MAFIQEPNHFKKNLIEYFSSFYDIFVPARTKILGIINKLLTYQTNIIAVSVIIFHYLGVLFQ
jgi:hypothetical protein